MSGFKKAIKTNSRLRMALIGPSGSGKTFTALSVASGLGRRVAVIDTERGSASKYSDIFDFDVLELESFAPERYIEGIRDAESYDVLVIDSLSHAWSGKDGLLEFVDKEAARSKTGNSFSAWRNATPKHNSLVDAILSAKPHVIVTMRAKTEYVQEKDERGKTQIRKVGLAPVQRDGLEYEFDVVGDLDQENNLIVSKSRCPALTGELINRAGEGLAATLKAWLTGEAKPQASKTKQPDLNTEAATVPAKTITKERAEALAAELKKLGYDTTNEAQLLEDAFGLSELEHLTDLTDGEAVILWKRLSKKAAEKAKEDAKEPWQKWLDDNDAITYGAEAAKQHGIFRGGGSKIMNAWDEHKNFSDADNLYASWYQRIQHLIEEEKHPTTLN